MQSPKRRRSTKTTKKRQTSNEDAFRLKAEPLLEALDSAIFQRINQSAFNTDKNIKIRVVCDSDEAILTSLNNVRQIPLN